MIDMKQIQKLQQDMQNKMGNIQAEMDKARVEASSGGGMVKVVMDGNQKLLEIKIQKDAIDPDDVEMTEDLVMAAVNSAVEKSRNLKEESMNQITGGLKIPGLNF